jgi:hypothetical protein
MRGACFFCVQVRTGLESDLHGSIATCCVHISINDVRPYDAWGVRSPSAACTARWPLPALGGELWAPPGTALASGSRRCAGAVAACGGSAAGVRRECGGRRAAGAGGRGVRRAAAIDPSHPHSPLTQAQFVVSVSSVRQHSLHTYRQLLALLTEGPPAPSLPHAGR